LLVNLDAHGARAVLLRRGNRDPSVTRSEIEHDVRRRDVRQLQHGVDDVIGRGKKADVRPMRSSL
jgi:hypothetical protein